MQLYNTEIGDKNAINEIVRDITIDFPFCNLCKDKVMNYYFSTSNVTFTNMNTIKKWKVTMYDTVTSRTCKICQNNVNA